MFEYFIFIVIKSTVYKEIDTLKLVDKVRANNTKQALMKAEENLTSDLYAGVDSSKMIAWNCARDCDKGDNWSEDTHDVREYNNKDQY